MNVRKFIANTSRDAWRKVRDTLGPDAVILSNRTVNGMVEIMAMPGEEMSSLAENTIMYKAALQLINKKLAALRYAATEGR